MRVITVVGIALIVIGVVSLVYQGITYTTREKVLEVGPAVLYQYLREALRSPHPAWRASFPRSSCPLRTC